MCRASRSVRPGHRDRTRRCWSRRRDPTRRVAPVAVVGHAGIADEVVTGQEPAGEFRVRGDAGVDDRDRVGCAAGLQFPGRRCVDAARRHRRAPIAADRAGRWAPLPGTRGAPDRRTGPRGRSGAARPSCASRASETVLGEREDPDVADLVIDGERRADSGRDARQQGRPVGRGGARQPEHAPCARPAQPWCLSTTCDPCRRRARPLPSRPTALAIIAQSLEHRGSRGGVERLRKREFERAGARRAGRASAGHLLRDCSSDSVASGNWPGAAE